jgi:hypothetical protein
MMTNPILPITELDFIGIKNQLKDYLRNDPSNRFRDYDFEGSNMSVLLDVLAYNTYQNNFYTNMAISEMFLDSAQLENSIVSHAKELNYLPQSTKSAKAVVEVRISDPENVSSVITIPENTRFITTHSGDKFSFFTDRQYIARRVGNDYITENVEIFEGEFVDEVFTFSSDAKTIRLLNSNIDISSLKVFENFDDPIARIEYVFRNDIFGVSSSDAVFYIEPSFDDTYEIVFGNNRFGRNPSENSQIRIRYRISSGNSANGACRFSTSVQSNNQSILARVSTISNAAGGAEKESIEDIKFFAPKSIQIQERAVTERDYEILLKQRFNEIKDISVFGGDKLDPPRFGKVAIAVNLEGGLSDIAARKYETFLRERSPVAIQPIFIAPEFLYVSLDVDVFYDPTLTRKSLDNIENSIRETIQEYAENRLNKFGAVFEISRVSTLIDSIDISIVNNTIKSRPYILYSPEFQRKDVPIFNFGSQLIQPSSFSVLNQVESFNQIVSSSQFIFNGTSAVFEDNGLGSIHIVDARIRSLGQIEIIKRNAGTVDYDTGIVKLSDFIVDSYDSPGIRVEANTLEKNVTSPKSRVLLLNDLDVRIQIKETTRR